MKPLSTLDAHWPEISVLLDEALDLPAASRAAWLEGLAGAQSVHRETLRAWRAHQADIEADDFLRDLPKLTSRRAGRRPAGPPPVRASAPIA